MPGAQQMLAIDKRLAGQQRQRLGGDLHHPFAIERGRRHVIAGQLAIRRVVMAQRKKFVEVGIAHTEPQTDGDAEIFPLFRAEAGRVRRPGAMRPIQ